MLINMWILFIHFDHFCSAAVYLMLSMRGKKISGILRYFEIFEIIMCAYEIHFEIVLFSHK